MPLPTPKRAVTAAPLDTYQRTAAGSKTAALADALSQLSPALARFGAVQTERAQQQAQLQADAYAAELNASQEQWAAAVKSGKIAAGQSPWMRFYAARKVGETAGAQFASGLQQKLAQLGDGATLEDFERAHGEARQAYLDDRATGSKDNLHFLSGFNATAEAEIANARRQFVAGEVQRTERNATVGYANAVVRAVRAGLKAREGAGIIAARVNAERTAYEAVNPNAKVHLSGETLDDVTAKTLLQVAVDTRNVKLVRELAGHVRGGTDTLENTAAYTGLNFSEAERTITRQQIADDATERSAHRQAVDEATEGVKGLLMQTWERGAPDVASAVQQLRAAGAQDAEFRVQELVRQLPEINKAPFVSFFDRISRGQWGGSMRDELLRAANANRISGSQYAQLVNEIEQGERHVQTLARQAQSDARRDAPTIQDVYRHPAMELIDATIRGYMQSKTPKTRSGAGSQQAREFAEHDVVQAAATAKLALQAWLAANPGAIKDGGNLEAFHQARIFAGSAALERGILTNPDEAQPASQAIQPRDKRGKVPGQGRGRTAAEPIDVDVLAQHQSEQRGMVRGALRSVGVAIHERQDLLLKRQQAERQARALRVNDVRSLRDKIARGVPTLTPGEQAVFEAAGSDLRNIGPRLSVLEQAARQ